MNKNKAPRWRRHKIIEEIIPETEWMSNEETTWHHNITSILINNSNKYGKFHYNAFAKRFQEYVIKIMPLSATQGEPMLAYIEDGTKVVTISEGLLKRPDGKFAKKLWPQLSVIIRHELCHSLYEHVCRMANKIGDILWAEIGHSPSVRELMNWCTDFDVSNCLYTQEDKDTISTMKVYVAQYGEIANGIDPITVGGLITENHRDWEMLSLEEMWEKTEQELDLLWDNLNDEGVLLDINKSKDGDYIELVSDMMDKQKNGRHSIGETEYKMLRMIADIKSPSTIWEPIDEYFNEDSMFLQYPPEVQAYFTNAYNEFKDLSSAQLEDYLQQIRNSKLIPIDLGSIHLATPEQKYFAIQVIKALLGNFGEKPKAVDVEGEDHSDEFVEAYNRIMDILDGKADDLSEAELSQIEDKIRKLIGI